MRPKKVQLPSHHIGRASAHNTKVAKARTTDIPAHQAKSEAIKNSARHPAPNRRLLTFTRHDSSDLAIKPLTIGKAYFWNSREAQRLHFNTIRRPTGVQVTTKPFNYAVIRLFLAGSNLREASLANANLTGANLSGANLTNADLSGADLTNTNFTGADLSFAVLKGAIVRDVTLDGARVFGLIRPNGRRYRRSEASKRPL